jgi:2-amino-4-hydroxy-6-hydroxymethyldihydropteridine diphosphokinase
VTRAFIGIGSNIAPEENIREALRRLARSTHVVSISTFYWTPAINRNQFDGGGARIQSAPRHRRLARAPAFPDKYASRTIDLDLLLYDNSVLSAGDLTLPHPDIVKRAFIAVPLYEIAPDLVLSGPEVPIRQVAQQLATEIMEPLPEYSNVW